ncbi:MAG: hypothetical protein FWH12_05625 [Treponema sp.]|nr:hypothetical protein [Treponema sp.]
MNRNYLIGLGVSVFVLGLLALGAWYFFEIYDTVSYVAPSREAQVNDYLALDRWLRDQGIPVQVHDSGDLSLLARSPQGRIFIQASLFRWSYGTSEYLSRWIERGGLLFLSLDFGRYMDLDLGLESSGVYAFIEEFGISLDQGTALPGTTYDSDSPSYDRSRAFSLLEPHADARLMLDWSGIARMVEVRRGRGALIVTGRPNFLSSYNIERPPNSRLAWGIFGSGTLGASDPQDEGWLFIRGQTRVQGILGSLFRQGNFTVLLISAVVLILICLWAVIPVFGLVRGDEEGSAKPLRERFLAEGRFLRRYRALDLYRQVYMREIRRGLARRRGLRDEEDQRLWMEETMKDCDMGLLRKIMYHEPAGPGEFPALVGLYKTILERI